MGMISPYGRVAVKAARRAGYLIKSKVGAVKKVSFKGSINIVTDIDVKAEDLIINELGKHFPAHSIISEEKRAVITDSEYKWVVDPLDGTTNFARSFPFFCVSIALERDCDVILGVVYDPMRDELFFAEKGKGAFLNKRRIKVSNVRRLSRGFLATGFAYDLRKASNTNVLNFSKFLKKALAIRRAGSAALDLAYVACARFDGFWEMNLYPWDSAAGSLIVKEAGGRVTRFNGSKYSHYDKEVLATNSLIHKQMIEVLTA